MIGRDLDWKLENRRRRVLERASTTASWIKTLNFTIKLQPVAAKVRRLNGRWKAEEPDDATAIYHIDVEKEVWEALKNEHRTRIWKARVLRLEQQKQGRRLP